MDTFTRDYFVAEIESEKESSIRQGSLIRVLDSDGMTAEIESLGQCKIIDIHSNTGIFRWDNEITVPTLTHYSMTVITPNNEKLFLEG